MQHRQEIDGFRALAVVSVIVFHTGLAPLPGGFLGVDMFFAISGYLITQQLIAALTENTFNLLVFYERRARRILPALFLVMAVSCAFAWAWLMPAEFKDFGKSLLAVLGFASNVFFARRTDYFADDADPNPLLHTWSLGVEEQFYLVFPVLLWLTWRFGGRRGTIWLLAIALVSSFIANLLGEQTRPAANFYSSFSRAWELLAGAMAATLSPEHAKHMRRAWQSPAEWVAVLAIFGVFLLPKDTSPAVLLGQSIVTGCTVFLLISANAENGAGRLLSGPIFTRPGLISYSAYLWHQPLLAFARARSLAPPEPWLLAALAVLSFALAAVTWRFVEQPFRGHRPRCLARRGPYFLVAVGVAIGFAAAGILAITTGGVPQRFDPQSQVNQIGEALAINHGLDRRCDGDFTLDARCATSATPDVLLWGDSFSMHLAQGMQAAGMGFRQISKSSCTPVLGMAAINQRQSLQMAHNCIAFNSQVIEWVAHSPVKTVVISSAFGLLNSQVLQSDGRRGFGDASAVLDGLMQAVESIRRTGQKS